MIKSLRLEMKSLKDSESSILNELGYILSFCACALPAKSIKQSLPDMHYVSFPVVTTTGEMRLFGQYRLPGQVSETQLPAVLILLSEGGVDSSGSFYAKALNEMGIATLELDLWSPRVAGGGTLEQPDTVQEALPDAYAALAYLARGTAGD